MRIPQKILILKTGNTLTSLRNQGVDYEDWIAAAMKLENHANPVEIEVISVHRGEDLPELELTFPKGIIITGSPGMLTDMEPWNYLLAAYVRDAHRLQIPILGICYGHQLVAWAFGGSVGFNPRGREIGTVTIDLTYAATNDPLFHRFPMHFAAQVSHSQSAIDLPAEAILLAGNAVEPHHAFRLGKHCWGVQFHPEFDAQITQAYIKDRWAGIEGEGLNPEKLLSEVEEAPIATSLLPSFLTLCLSSER